MTPTDSTDTNAYFNPDTEAHMRRITSGLAHRYEGIFGKETIESVVEDSYRELPDPAGLALEQVRPIRDEIRGKVVALIDELTPANR